MSNSQKIGGWMQTYRGDRVYPLSASPEELDINDIAHSLAMQCRYNGHCKRFYSVAEHSYLLSYLVDEEYAFDALMHDASEAYLCDIPRPLKPFLVGYYDYEDKLMKQIAEKYHFTWPMPPQVKDYDTRILNDERKANMNPSKHEWDYYGDELGATLLFLNPQEAEYHFLKRYFELVK